MGMLLASKPGNSMGVGLSGHDLKVDSLESIRAACYLSTLLGSSF